MMSETSQKTQKNSNGTKPMLINMVKAITTRSKARTTDLAEEDRKQLPIRIDTNPDEAQMTEVNEEASSNNCKTSSRDTSVKEM